MTRGGSKYPALEAVLALPANRACADCGKRSPQWAAVNLGIAICLECSGAHRHLGVHISVVRSAKLDDWKPEWVELLRRIGNDVSNSFYERHLPSSGRLCPGESPEKVESWIRDKYQLRLFAPECEPSPVEQLSLHQAWPEPERESTADTYWPGSPQMPHAATANSAANAWPTELKSSLSPQNPWPWDANAPVAGPVLFPVPAGSFDAFASWPGQPPRASQGSRRVKTSEPLEPLESLEPWGPWPLEVQAAKAKPWPAPPRQRVSRTEPCAPGAACSPGQDNEVADVLLTEAGSTSPWRRPVSVSLRDVISNLRHVAVKRRPEPQQVYQKF